MFSEMVQIFFVWLRFLRDGLRIEFFQGIESFFMGIESFFQGVGREIFPK